MLSRLSVRGGSSSALARTAPKRTVLGGGGRLAPG
eukprot:CAMPEP_0113583030 /NCGR_PEP_ID=MMETSP0015_2-20120614/32266_1 /TAXON_ID=2838 /ORGANISM="Odontella" /LENGTH=34 /DNA_ID=CAMNT_0000487813 /DNA_START=166 /DNA_END=266 /DNA_ORIENTATION=- /assembly_acc=CAM_ASM_000160